MPEPEKFINGEQIEIESDHDDLIIDDGSEVNLGKRTVREQEVSSISEPSSKRIKIGDQAAAVLEWIVKLEWLIGLIRNYYDTINRICNVETRGSLGRLCSLHVRGLCWGKRCSHKKFAPGVYLRGSCYRDVWELANKPDQLFSIERFHVCFGIFETFVLDVQVLIQNIQ